MRTVVQRLKELADRVTEAFSPMLGPPNLRETDVRLRPFHGSLDVCSNAIALQQLGVLHEGKGHDQDSTSCHGGWDSSDLLKDRPLPSRRLDFVLRQHDAALVLLGVLVFVVLDAHDREDSDDVCPRLDATSLASTGFASSQTLCSRRSVGSSIIALMAGELRAIGSPGTSVLVIIVHQNPSGPSFPRCPVRPSRPIIS